MKCQVNTLRGAEAIIITTAIAETKGQISVNSNKLKLVGVLDQLFKKYRLKNPDTYIKLAV